MINSEAHLIHMQEIISKCTYIIIEIYAIRFICICSVCKERPLKGQEIAMLPLDF